MIIHTYVFIDIYVYIYLALCVAVQQCLIHKWLLCKEMLFVMQTPQRESESVLFASWQLQDTPAKVSRPFCPIGLS